MENGKKMITVVGAYMILKGILNLILGFSASNLVSLLFAAVLIFAMLKRIPYSQYVTAIFLALIFLVNLPANLSNLGSNWIYLVEGLLDVGAAAILAFHKDVKDYCIPSHKSEEIGYNIAIEQLGLTPMLNLSMRLGEGSGCPIAFSVIEFAMAMMNNMATFDEAHIDDDYLDEVRGEENYIV